MGDASWNLLLSEQLRHNGRLFFRLAHNVLRDPVAAEDVCQQAFLRAWEQRDCIAADAGSLKGWLARTVINGSIQILRRGKVEQRVLSAQAHLRPAEVGGGGGGEVPGEVREAVLAAVAKLPETPRCVVVMRLLQGMSGGEVKDLLGCSAAEVSRQLHRGMDELRHLLADCDAGAVR